SSPAPPGPALPAAAARQACCIPCSSPPADPETTAAPARRTTAHAPASRAAPAEGALRPPPATARSTHLHSATRTASGSPVPLPALHVYGSPASSPSASGLPTRRSYHPVPLAPPPAPRRTIRRVSPPPDCAAPSTRPPRPTPAPAAPAYPASRSLSAAVPPAR